jgi:hypothetical protein
LDQVTPLTEALTGYYDYASPGDLIKSHSSFATFSADKHWVGDLTALTPGEGYLMRRMGKGAVTVNFYKRSTNAPKKVDSRMSIVDSQATFNNPNAATNMTMIAMINDGMSATASLNDVNDVLKVYVGDELACVATPIDSLYFLTIQSDRVGELRFDLNGETYVSVSGSISYTADSHHGSVLAPIILRKDDNRPYKIIENDHVIIIRNGERYDITGKKL